MTKSSKQAIVAVAACAVLVVGALGAWVGKSALDRANAEKQEARVMAEWQAKKETDARNREIEETLNGLLENVQVLALEYKRNRRVVNDLIQPENLSTPEYIVENLAILEGLIPSLENERVQMMSAFDTAGERFNEIISTTPEQTQNALNAQWEEVTGHQIKSYTTFFAFEQAIVATYLDILRLYAENKDQITYDRDADILVFGSDALAARDQELRGDIGRLHREQAVALQALTAGIPADPAEVGAATEAVTGDGAATENAPVPAEQAPDAPLGE